MKITFPHMGNAYIPLKALFEELGIEVIIPPKCNKKTLELGMKHSPELICLPFKLNLGNFIEAIKLGADTLFMTDGCGAICRIGMYNDLQDQILQELGHKVEMIAVPPFTNVSEMKIFLKTLKKISGKSYPYILTTFAKVIKVMLKIDELHDLINKIRPREIKRGSADKLYDEFESKLVTVKGSKQTITLIDGYIEKANKIEIDNEREVLKIGIVGEIYTIIEPFVNLNIEKKLGYMGVEVNVALSNSQFIKESWDFMPFVKSHTKELRRAAKPYIDTRIGGHTQETIGDTLLFKEKGYDGIIHLLPFGCMPEIISMSMLKNIEKDVDMPILSLVLDEMTGEAGYITRIEAFIDLLRRKKEVA